jgi:hypothetical protein
MTPAIVAQLEEEWEDLDHGFFGLVRLRQFDQEAYGRVMALLAACTAAGSEPVPADLVRELWYMPWVLQWTADGLDDSGLPSGDFWGAANRIHSELERILGVPRDLGHEGLSGHRLLRATAGEVGVPPVRRNTWASERPAPSRIAVATLIAQMRAEWDLDHGFFSQAWNGRLDPDALGRVKILLAACPPEGDQFQADIVKLLWYMPWVVEWAAQRLDRQGRPSRAFWDASNYIRSELERIFGVP